MDLAKVGAKLRPRDMGVVSEGQWNRILRKAKELQRMCNLKFDAASFGIGEVAKGVMSLELASAQSGVRLDRRACIKASGMSDKAYPSSLNVLQNALGIRLPLDIRELAIQFGCVRLVDIIRNNLNEFTNIFKLSLSEERRKCVDFSRPVFLAAAFYLTARKHKLKVDRPKLVEVTRTTEEELQRVSCQMQELCPLLFGMRPGMGRKGHAEETCGTEQQKGLPGMGRKRHAEDAEETALGCDGGERTEQSGAAGVRSEQRRGVGPDAVGKQQHQEHQHQFGSSDSWKTESAAAAAALVQRSSSFEAGVAVHRGSGMERREGHERGGDESFDEWKERMRRQEQGQDAVGARTGLTQGRMKQAKLSFK